MYQDYPYPPGPARLRGDYRGRPLPPLPTRPFLSAIIEYRPDRKFDLRSNNPGETDNVQLLVLEPVDAGYGCFSQSVKAIVIQGPSELINKTVFAKFYDPLYIIPDVVYTICIIFTFLTII